MTKDEALDLALEALEESVDLVREDYENAKKLYSNYPSRQARLLGLEDGLSKHEAAITAIKQARALDKKAENARELGLDYEPVNQRAHEMALRQWDHWKQYALELQERLVKYEGGASMVLNTTPPAQPAPVQEPVASVPIHPKTGPLWAMTTDKPDPERLPSYPLMSLYTTPPAAQRRIEELEAQLMQMQGRELKLQMALNTPAAQRQWVGLTDEEIDKTHETQVWDARRSYARAIEAKLKEKNT